MGRAGRGDGLEHLIARGVTEFVVDDLEVIKIHQGEHAGIMTSVKTLDRFLDFGAEAAAAERAGEIVAFGDPSQFELVYY